MSEGKAMIRELVERVDGVRRTWFELEIEGGSRTKTLVVEVNLDLDANSTQHLRSACDEIEKTFSTILREENSDMVSKLRIVNQSSQAGGKSADTSAPGQSAKSTRGQQNEQRGPTSPN
jgi:hypothetical protein